MVGAVEGEVLGRWEVKIDAAVDVMELCERWEYGR